MARLDLNVDVAVKGEEDLKRTATDLGKVEKAADSLSGTLKKGALAGVGFFGVQAIGDVAGKAAEFFADATNAAAEFQDTVGAAGVIMGQEALPALEEWGDTAAEAFGASKQLAIESANQMAIFGKSAGLAGDDLTQFATELTQLGGDLASFFGGSTQDAITAIGAALRGESEPIRRYGVLLDDATLKQKALELGLISTTKNALTPQQRVLAAHAEILEQTADAQGDFARTSNNLANQQRILQAKLENVTEEIGEKLLPIVTEVVTFLNDDGIPAFQTFIDMLSGADSKDAEGFFGDVERFFKAVGDSAIVAHEVLTFRENDIRAAAERIGVDFVTMATQVENVMDNAGVDFDTALTRIETRATDFSGRTPTIISQSLKHATSDIDEAATDMADGIPEAMETALDEAKDVAKKTPGELADSLRAGLDDYDDALQELTDIATKSVSDLAERQKIEGILASQQLTDALNSDSTRTRLLAVDLVEDLVGDYELLEPGALAAGQLVNPALADGLQGNIDTARDAAEDVGAAVSAPLAAIASEAFTWGANITAEVALGLKERRALQQVRDNAYAIGGIIRDGVAIFSEPKDPNSPLRGITQWGGNMVTTIADGIRGNLREAESATQALGASLAFSPATSANLGAMVSGPRGAPQLAGASSGVTVNLFVDGDLRASEDTLPATLQRAVYVAGLADQYER